MANHFSFLGILLAPNPLSLGDTFLFLYPSTGKILFPGKSNNEMLRMQMEAMGRFSRKMLRQSKFWQRHFNSATFYFQQICIDEVSQQVLAVSSLAQCLVWLMELDATGIC